MFLWEKKWGFCSLHWIPVIVLLAHFGPHRERRLGKAERMTLASQHGWVDCGGDFKEEENAFACSFLCCETLSHIRILFFFLNAADEWTQSLRSDVWQPHQLCPTYSKSIFNRVALLFFYYEGDNFLIVNNGCKLPIIEISKQRLQMSLEDIFSLWKRS